MRKRVLLYAVSTGSAIGFCVIVDSSRFMRLRLAKTDDGAYNSTKATYLSALMRQQDFKKREHQQRQKRDTNRGQSSGLLPPPPGDDGSALPDLNSWSLFKRTPPATPKANNRKSKNAALKQVTNNKNSNSVASGLAPLSQLFGVDVTSKSDSFNKNSTYMRSTPGNIYASNDYKDDSKTSNFSTSSPPSASTAIPTSTTNTPTALLDGVLPVSELFYRSSQAMSAQDDQYEQENDSYLIDSNPPFCNLGNGESLSGPVQDDVPNKEFSDDDELPFSAEQSDTILTHNNKVKVRRNQAQNFDIDHLSDASQIDTESNAFLEDPTNTTKNLTNTSKQGYSLDKKSNMKKKGSSHTPLSPKETTSSSTFSNKSNMKMVRRGMEMLVGGIPINVDPPLRFIELSYNFSATLALSSQKMDSGNIKSWKEPIEEATPWAVHDQLQSTYDKLKGILDADWAHIITTNSRDFGPLLHGPSVHKTSTQSRSLYCEYMGMALVKWSVCPKDYEDVITSFEQRYSKMNRPQLDTPSSTMMIRKRLERIIVETKSMNTRTESNMSPPSSFHLLKDDDVQVMDDEDGHLNLGGELKFSMDISRSEMEATFDGESGLGILKRVLSQGLSNAIKSDTLGYNVTITNILLNEVDGGATEFTVEFHLFTQRITPIVGAGRIAKQINSALAQAMDDGEVALSMGAAAKIENAWPLALRDRIVEEFLFELDDTDDVKPVLLDDEDDFESFREIIDDHNGEASAGTRIEQYGDVFDGPFGMPGDLTFGKNDIFLGGGNGGVFYDYSETGLERAPFKGSLGPLLLDAVVQRSIQRHPRIIAIGDVHGCIDELQELLRKCDYRIGDLVLFLGDLVSKGPDSLSVVQMAREIGAIGVRGNHDFEVVRWHQAIKSGADPPVIGSEHFQIATQLSKADLRWMYSLPWYISSKDLGALFVHAGFVSGIRLAKQNPRLMMNMRSILPDGTVTSKFFKVWPWARLWDGPQTVFFGHDADRGLQQYEHAIGLDTGCVYGGKLTACILPEKRLVSVNAKKQYFQYRRRHFD